MQNKPNIRAAHALLPQHLLNAPATAARWWNPTSNGCWTPFFFFFFNIPPFRYIDPHRQVTYGAIKVSSSSSLTCFIFWREKYINRFDWWDRNEFRVLAKLGQPLEIASKGINLCVSYIIIIIAGNGEKKKTVLGESWKDPNGLVCAVQEGVDLL